MGPSLFFSLDESDAHSTIITEHTSWAPNRFVVPPDGTKREGDFVVNHKNTDCTRTVF